MSTKYKMTKKDIVIIIFFFILLAIHIGSYIYRHGFGNMGEIIEQTKMRCLPLKNLDVAKEKIKSLVVSGYPVMIDQKKIDSAKICYKKVKYYINVMDIMFIPEIASELSSILAFLIQEKADLSTIDKLVIPHDSNFLLGVEVGKKLEKSVVKIRYSHGKIETEKYWDVAGRCDLPKKSYAL